MSLVSKQMEFMKFIYLHTTEDIRFGPESLLKKKVFSNMFFGLLFVKEKT